MAHEQRVYLRGSLDYATETETRAVLAEAMATGAQAIVADAGDVTFVDSSGLRALLMARQALENEGRRFSITNASAAMQRIFEISGLSEFVDMR